MSMTEARWYVDVPPVAPRIDGVLSVATVVTLPAGHKALIGAEYETDACDILAHVWPGDACTPVDLNVAKCVPPPPPPPPPGRTACVVTHPDYPHPMGWLADVPPGDWVGPCTIDWGDGTVEQSVDCADSHEYSMEGTYIVTFSDSAGHTCRVAVTVPHNAQASHACFDPTPLTVAEAITQIGDDLTCAHGVLVLEQSGKNRSTLIAHLQEMLGGGG